MSDAIESLGKSMQILCGFAFYVLGIYFINATINMDVDFILRSFFILWQILMFGIGTIMIITALQND